MKILLKILQSNAKLLNQEGKKKLIEYSKTILDKDR